MANNVLRQYRTALKSFNKRVNEFASYEGRTYSTKYYELQNRIERMENAIKNRNYTNAELKRMIKTLRPRSVWEYVVEYSVSKDKFVQVGLTGDYTNTEKRKINEVPSISQVKQEAIRNVKKEERQETGGQATDYNGALFTEIYNWCKIQAPKGIVKELLELLDKLAYTSNETITAFERAANKVGIDHIPYGYDDIDKLCTTAHLALALYELPEDSPMWNKLKEWQAQRGSNSEYDTTEFGERK